jgi:hypothetical protein
MVLMNHSDSAVKNAFAFFSCFGIGGVYQNPDEKKGGFSRPSKF